jgi:hypothetical protein
MAMQEKNNSINSDGKEKKKRFNLRDLEDKCLIAYANFETDSNEFTRTQVFLTIKELAFAVLSVGPYSKNGLDFDKVSYEYSIYLFERIVLGTFKMKGHTGRFPLQQYVRKNIKHVIYTMRDIDVWKDVVSDLEFLMNDDSLTELDSIIDPSPAPCHFIDRHVSSAKLLDLIRMYYTYEEIRRLLAISIEHIYGNWYQYINSYAPSDVKDFVVVLVASAKRVVRVDNVFYGLDMKKSTVKKALSSAVRSTVFMSTVVNSEFFPKELLLSLDLDSLYRLVSVMGGKNLRIPTQKELNTLIGGVVAASKVILEGKDSKDVKKTIKDTRNDYDLVFSSRVDIQFFVSKAIENFNLFKNESSSEPLINLLVSSINSLDKLFKTTDFKSKDGSEIMEQYIELSNAFSNITNSLLSISNKAPQYEEPIYTTPIYQPEAPLDL